MTSVLQVLIVVAQPAAHAEDPHRDTCINQPGPSQLHLLQAVLELFRVPICALRSRSTRLWLLESFETCNSLPGILVESLLSFAEVDSERLRRALSKGANARDQTHLLISILQEPTANQTSYESSWACSSALHPSKVALEEGTATETRCESLCISTLMAQTCLELV